ncbi:BMP family ABC transporter substrate-binding protein [Anaeromyxobacter sp. Fw109-5]|uniref:BMP family ABC transporter substrate-binding protein n=1 Tax=Anaeromyxobacter sp. (strain Fw109-5) TaxID=404589 RepID=UPI0000ED8A5A|nr:BMP family ABC transporter substrate-binding protein [Anaeromyxobacter sp. Fw109-5]ABS27372.1 basic membrane lipoprotein [Anaeromyxobacter sp. Fw109-5]
MTRSFTRKLALGAAVLAATLAACAKKEEAPPAPAAAPVAKAEPLKAAFVYVGPVGDAGWSFSHDLGRRNALARFGDKVTTTFVEKVPEGPDAERVIRDLVAQGNKVVFATSFGFMDAMVKVSKDHPDVYFEHATGYKTAENLRVYEARFYEGAYLAGVVAGKMTKTNSLGFVASFPIPEVLRNINAFTLGAQSVNPKVKTRVVWINSWFDPPKETEAAQSLLNQGADVLLQNTDSTAVLQAAERNGKFAFGWDSDMSAFAPKAHLGSVALNWTVYYEKSFAEILEKRWKTEVTKWGVKEGMLDFVKPAAFLPEEAKMALEAARDGLKTGTVAVFKGPIVDNTGKEVLAKDAVADDAWKGAINFYVKGVEGKVPSGM